MSWDSGLLPDQKRAACHIGSHACVRAGPGTGKTLTLARRIVYLAVEKAVPPSEILVLTFTRAAVREIRERIREELRPYGIELPRISTLHSFALRQLLRNSDVITSLPAPIRIADDWEEDYIIRQDLSHILGIGLRDVDSKFNQLSADWCTLTENGQPDPRFLGAWREHSSIYGYTMRIQLVYELKKALGQAPAFKLEQSFKYLLVDEYQDLNPCDLAVIQRLAEQGVEVFAAGDDDQSIYGFRFAYPDGIRSFERDYQPSSLFELKYCKRCDKAIIDIGQFVVRLDPRRIDKPLLPMPNGAQGEVRLLWFRDQHEEARTVADVCKFFIANGIYLPKNILILLRSDHQRSFSDIIIEALEKQAIPTTTRTDYVSPLDTNEGRQFLSYLRLYVRQDDDFAWRTLIEIRDNRIGPVILSHIHELALKQGIRFTDALDRIKDSPDCIPRWGNRLCSEIGSISRLLDELKELNVIDYMSIIKFIAERIITDTGSRQQVLDYLGEITDTYQAETITDLISALSVSMGDQEQEIDPEKVNILTMHRAKGLTANVVFLIGAEDEYIPGRQIGHEEWDARRLLYVSLTRAKHTLIITQCQRRTGRQAYTGSGAGQRRQLSRFLRDYPIVAEYGIDYLNSLPQAIRVIPDISTPIGELRFCFLDLETTGLDPTRDRVCEIGLVKTKVQVKGEESRETFSSVVNPGCGIPQDASKIHGITDDDIKDAKQFHELADYVLDFIQGCVLVAHNNAGFDLPFLVAELQRAGRKPPQSPCLCTLQLAQRHFSFPDNRLETIARSLGVQREEEHRALPDALALEEIFRSFLRQFQEGGTANLGDLMDLQGGPIQIPIIQIH